ncbi:MAG: DUF1049 domain-containing protein [Deltaproteobacteria bacterium]|nr:DUF1049 domain-containing protein [Deltaproteobacteria bacterium]
MINKAIKIIAALVLIGLCLYVVTQNSAAAKVYLTPGWSISASTGVILIIVFVLGLLCATIVAAYFAVRAGLRERRLLRAEQERQAFF